MLRFGIITEIIPADGKARVKFGDDDVVSAPLPVLFLGTKTTTFYFPYANETPVAVLMDEHNEDGVIIGAIYTDEDKPAASVNDKSLSLIFPDSTKVVYDWDAKTLTVDGGTDLTINIQCKKATVNASNGVDITGDVKITGKLEVTDDVKLDAKIDVTGAGTFSNKITADGKILSNTEVQALTVKLTTHVHTGGTMSGSTGVPTP